MNKNKKAKKVFLTLICAALLAISALAVTGCLSDNNKDYSIGTNNALSIAFADAGIQGVDAKVVNTEYDAETGMKVYEISFVVDNTEYVYWILAEDGTVVRKEMRLVTNGNETIVPSNVTLDQAKNIALADAGLTAAEVTFTKARLDNDNGVAVYDIEFFTSTHEYDYEITAADGTIRSKEIDGLIIDPDPSGSYMSVEAAKQAALADAGLTEAEVTFRKAQFDFDDGIAVYDIEFFTSTHKYEYEINALTGNVHKKEKELITGSSVPSENYIGVEAAKQAALADAGITEAEATFQKAQFDFDDGIAVYDIEFFTSTHEYEYEINAVNGSIHSREIEMISGGSAPSEDYIGVEAAKQAALADAGLTEAEVAFKKAQFDFDDGLAVYDIEFFTSTHEYDYEINAVTGSVHSKDIEVISGGSAPSENYIGVEAAKQAALADAGLTEAEITFRKAQFDFDDGIAVYDIEFYTSTHEYEYEINAVNGSIHSREIEMISGGSAPSEDYIGVEAAKQAALADAGLTEAEVTFRKAQFDFDDGIAVYDIEFFTSTHEYEYEINAVTGKVHSKEAERFTSGQGGNNGNIISLDEAKAIASEHAGFYVSEVIFTEAEFDSDDGLMIYEIEFFVNGVEYEYEINASTGDIIKYEVDRD